MPLNDFILGLNVLEGTSVVTSNAYNKIEVDGQITIDYIKVLNFVVDDSVLDNITLSDIVTWDSHTLFWADFNNSLDAGNIVYLQYPIKSMNLKRLKDGATVLVDIGTVDSSITQMYDYTATTGSYTYYLFPQSDYEIGQSLMTNSVTVDYYSWSLTRLDTGQVYKFDLNVESGQIDNEVDSVILNNFTQYPKVNMGKRNYLKNTFKTMIGIVDDYGNYTCTPQYVKELRDFINDGEIKLLKDRSGNAWYVFTYCMPQSADDPIQQQPQTIQFNWVQVADSPN